MRVKYKGFIKSLNVLDERKKYDIDSNWHEFMNDDGTTMTLLGIGLIFLIGPLSHYAFLLKSWVCHIDVSGTINMAALSGVILLLLSAPLHEYLHMIQFPSGSDFEIYIVSILGILCYCETPYKKKDTFKIYLTPLLVLGIIPFLIWLWIPFVNYFERTLFYFSLYSMGVCVGDVFYSIRIMMKVPKHAWIVDKGNISYWYLPNDEYKS